MKKILFTLIAVLTMTSQASAMSYEQARREALFLTDKMAYELNLSDAQYEAAYEINLDYLMGVTGRADVFGTYWERRNADLNYVLYSWQWELFRAATYFFRPLYWDAGYWHFGVYARYPHRDYYYFGCPHFYVSYRGGHCWHRNGGRSFYERHHGYYRPHTQRTHHFGMRDGWNRGDYSRSGHGNSSTRVTGSTHNHHDGNVNSQNSGGGRNNSGNGRNGGNGFTLGNSRMSERSNGNVSRSSSSAGSLETTGRSATGLGNSRGMNRSLNSNQLSRSLNNSSVSGLSSSVATRMNGSSVSRSSSSSSRTSSSAPTRISSGSSVSRMNHSSASRMSSSASRMSSGASRMSSSSSRMSSSSSVHSNGASMSRGSSAVRSSGSVSSSSGGGRSGGRR